MRLTKCCFQTPIRTRYDPSAVVICQEFLNPLLYIFVRDDDITKVLWNVDLRVENCPAARTAILAPDFELVDLGLAHVLLELQLDSSSLFWKPCRREKTMVGFGEA
eukprot:3896569-Rhodomonas_salina.1